MGVIVFVDCGAVPNCVFQLTVRPNISEHVGGLVVNVVHEVAGLNKVPGRFAIIVVFYAHMFNLDESVSVAQIGGGVLKFFRPVMKRLKLERAQSSAFIIDHGYPEILVKHMVVELETLLHALYHGGFRNAQREACPVIVVCTFVKIVGAFINATTRSPTLRVLR